MDCSVSQVAWVAWIVRVARIARVAWIVRVAWVAWVAPTLSLVLARVTPSPLAKPVSCNDTLPQNSYWCTHPVIISAKLSEIGFEQCPPIASPGGW